MKLDKLLTKFFKWLLTIKIIISVIVGANSVQAAKILSVSIMASKSHVITYEPLLQELARRGHEVTVIGPVELEAGKNFRYIPVNQGKDLFNFGHNPFDKKPAFIKYLSPIINPLLFFVPKLADICSESYQLPEIQQLTREKYDLVIFLPLFNECLYGLLHKMNTSTILFQQVSILPRLASNLGIPSPPSFVSSGLQGNSDRMNFFERFGNFWNTIYTWALSHFYYYPTVEKVYRSALGDDSIPSVEEIERNASLVLTNSQISFDFPKPLMPNVIEIGGLSLRQAKPVPKDLDDFLTGSGEDGFIYFNMGSILKASLMPDKFRQIFLNVFKKLKQRVIWKWETEEMEGLPPNVKLSKWLPQQDILGHKNIRLFMTHGGHGGVTEAIYHGVPILGFPIQGDQPSNMKKAVKKGFALEPLEFSDLTEEILMASITEALTNPRYRDNARKLSAVSRDQMENSLDRAIYWVEYVLRHQGAVHLRSAGMDLNMYQYYSLDVIAFLILLTLISVKINIMIVKAVFRKCTGKRKTD